MYGGVEARVQTVRPEARWQSDAIHWEAEARHLKKTAAELLDTNNRYGQMFEVVKSEGRAHVSQLQALLGASALESRLLRQKLEQTTEAAAAEEAHRMYELSALRGAVGRCAAPAAAHDPCDQLFA